MMLKRDTTGQGQAEGTWKSTRNFLHKLMLRLGTLGTRIILNLQVSFRRCRVGSGSSLSWHPTRPGKPWQLPEGRGNERSRFIGGLRLWPLDRFASDGQSDREPIDLWESKMSEIPLTYDDTGGSGPLVILLPGAGDVRSENRFLIPGLREAGYRVINADLPGHGESPVTGTYGVAQTADALLALIQGLRSGPACVIGTSFAPAAMVWAAATRPESIRAIVAISPHLEVEETLSGRFLGVVISGLLRAPWAAWVWSRLYQSWYKSRIPDDLREEIDRMRTMLRDSSRRRAVRETLTAHRNGMSDKIDVYNRPALVVFGSADDHFPDPAAEASRVSSRLHGEVVMVAGAGHYPHVERPDIVGPAVVGFLNRFTG